jgi:pimeloyl-ACP methyl ester carboxylesterase
MGCGSGASAEYERDQCDKNRQSAEVSRVADVKSLFRWRPFRPTQEDHRITQRRGKIAVNGTTLYYEMAGNEPYVVFIPTTGSDRRMWEEQVRTFAQHYTVVRYDLRGFGKSALTAGSFRHAEDLAALLDALDIVQATLIGFQHGANIAVECALDHPERVQAMALVKPFMDHSLERYTPGVDPALDRFMTGVDRFMTDLLMSV